MGADDWQLVVRVFPSSAGAFPKHKTPLLASLMTDAARTAKPPYMGVFTQRARRDGFNDTCTLINGLYYWDTERRLGCADVAFHDGGFVADTHLALRVAVSIQEAVVNFRSACDLPTSVKLRVLVTADELRGFCSTFLRVSHRSNYHLTVEGVFDSLKADTRWSRHTNIEWMGQTDPLAPEPPHRLRGAVAGSGPKTSVTLQIDFTSTISKMVNTLDWNAMLEVDDAPSVTFPPGAMASFKQLYASDKQHAKLIVRFPSNSTAFAIYFRRRLRMLGQQVEAVSIQMPFGGEFFSLSPGKDIINAIWATLGLMTELIPVDDSVDTVEIVTGSIRLVAGKTFGRSNADAIRGQIETTFREGVRVGTKKCPVAFLDTASK